MKWCAFDYIDYLVLNTSYTVILLVTRPPSGLHGERQRRGPQLHCDLQFFGQRQPAGSFAINCYTGVVTLTQMLDRQEQAVHRLVVWASDSLHQTTAEVLVQVLDVNDNVPVFSQDSYQVARATICLLMMDYKTVIVKEHKSLTTQTSTLW